MTHPHLILSRPTGQTISRRLAVAALASLLAASLGLTAQNAAAPTSRPNSSPTSSPAPRNDGSRPEPKVDDGKFLRLHNEFLARGDAGPVGLLFLGDSITAGWNTRAKALFDATYGHHAPANFGIGGDKTQHVLWRIRHGELDKPRPKVVVLMIGTNNTGSNTAPEIAAAVRLIVSDLRTRLPDSKVLLLAIFPRGPRTSPNGQPDDGTTKMAIIRQVNADLAKLDDGKTVRFLDIGEKFLVDGKIPDAIMPDQLHPSLAGYEIWASAMRPLLDDMLKE